jgi:membrane protease subunit HflK
VTPPDVEPQRPAPVAAETEPSLDPAQQSLSDALRLSFAVLKVVMIVLAVFFLASGFFTVNQKQAALVLRFGVPLGGVDNPRVYGPGLHWALPYPVDRQLIIDLAKESVEVESFFFKVAETEKDKARDELRIQAEGYTPGQDGMLLTADLSIIHAKWFAEYRVDDPVAYVRHVSVARETDPKAHEQARRELVRSAVQNACVRTVGAFHADDILGGRIDLVQQTIRLRAQGNLNRMGTGITIDQLLVRDPQVPLAVRSAYDNAQNADQEKQTAIEEARKQRNTMLNETAGVAYEQLLPVVERYEQARADGDLDESTRLHQQIERLLLDEAGGEAAGMLLEARSYYTETVQSIQATARKFRDLLPNYRRNPDIVLIELWYDTKRTVLGGDNEKMYLPAGGKEIRFKVGRNPAHWRDQELRRYRQQTEGR